MTEKEVEKSSRQNLKNNIKPLLVPKKDLLALAEQMKEVEVYSEVEAFVLGALIEEQITIEIERYITLELKTESIFEDEECTKVSLSLYKEDEYTNFDREIEIQCRMCNRDFTLGSYAHNTILKDKSRTAYDDTEIIAELGLVKAVQKHFKEYHPVYYEEFIERTNRELVDAKSGN